MYKEPHADSSKKYVTLLNETVFTETRKLLEYDFEN